jgi:hypothetical protein
MANHAPANLALFRRDLGESQVATVRCRDGYPQDCLRFGGDQMNLVLEPSIVWTHTDDSRRPSRLSCVGLDHAITVEFNRGSRQEVRWVRDPSGIWLRLANQGS